MAAFAATADIGQTRGILRKQLGSREFGWWSDFATMFGSIHAIGLKYCQKTRSDHITPVIELQEWAMAY